MHGVALSRARPCCCRRRCAQWNLDFMQNSDEGKAYMDLAHRVNEAIGFMMACGMDANDAIMRETDFFTSHECLLLDYEEALLLACVLVFLIRAHPAFHRRAAFFETRFSTVWVATVLGTLGASVWLGFFAFKHVDYSGELWWEFALRGEASRFLRASVGAAVVILLFGVARLVRPAPHEVVEPSADDLRAAAAIIALVNERRGLAARNTD